MSLVLYRKYRPQKFSEIVGQEHIVKTISNALASNSVGHAYLFSGPRGTGKTTLARILAKSLNCLGRNGSQFEPCEECLPCGEIKGGRAPDIIEIDAASNRGIDEIRDLKEEIRTVPAFLKYKVYIIDECHMLTREAFNALLKMLEEPPSHVVFVLATTEIHKVPATILSRVQRFDFMKLNIDEIVSRLSFLCKSEKINVEQSALEFIAATASGSIRDAESLLDQIIAYRGDNISKNDIEGILGIVGLREAMAFVESLAKKNSAQALLKINKLYGLGYDLSQFSKSVIDYLRDLLLVRIDKTLLDQKIYGFSSEEFAAIYEQSQNFSEENLRKIVEIFIEAQNEIKRSPIPQLPLELAVMETMELENRK